MRLGNLIWNILNFMLLLGVIIVLAWPLIGPSTSKSKLKPNQKSFIEHLFEKNDNSNNRRSHNKSFNISYPLGTDSFGKDKINTIANATLQNVGYAFVALIPFLLFGILAGLLLAFSNERRNIGDINQYLSFGGIVYLITDWSVRILHSIPVVIVIVVGVIFAENLAHKDLRIYYLMLFFGVVSIPLLAYDIEKEVNFLRKQEFIKASEALGISRFRLICVDVLWFSCRDIIFSRSINLFLTAIAIEIFKTHYMSSSTDVYTLGTLFGEYFWLDYNYQLVFFLCMVFLSVRWFTERLIYDDGVNYG